MDDKRARFLVVRNAPLSLHSRINEHTPAARGNVFGSADRARRDEVGEKLHLLWQESVRIRREEGKESGPFQLKDWMRA